MVALANSFSPKDTIHTFIQIYANIIIISCYAQNEDFFTCSH